jgi:hypothetical protein
MPLLLPPSLHTSVLPLRLRCRNQRCGDFFVVGEAEPLGAVRRRTESFRTAEGRAERERASAKVFDALAVAGERVGPVTTNRSHVTKLFKAPFLAEISAMISAGVGSWPSRRAVKTSSQRVKINLGGCIWKPCGVRANE